MSQILRIASGVGDTKTKFVYKAFINYEKVKENLTILTESDLLNYDADTQIFKTTKKGLRFLQIYNQIDDMIKTSQRPPQQQQI
jgi:predicted transcriptional regulator